MTLSISYVYVTKPSLYCRHSLFGMEKIGRRGEWRRGEEKEIQAF
jgi:hypothetical protein